MVAAKHPDMKHLEDPSYWEILIPHVAAAKILLQINGMLTLTIVNKKFLLSKSFVYIPDTSVISLKQVKIRSWVLCFSAQKDIYPT